MVRNLFDQYEHPENRLTHALVCCLDSDRQLLGRFLRRFLGASAAIPKKLSIIEQTIPGEPEPHAGDESDSLPDAWIHDGKNWCVLLESKIRGRLGVKQLRNHRSVAERCQFTRCSLLALVTSPPTNVPRGVIVVKWCDLYGWMDHRRNKSKWAERMANYMEVLEMKLIDSGYLQSGALTMFSGIPFLDRPYTYIEAKRLLKLAMDELRDRPDLKKLGVSPPKKQKAIKGQKTRSVWDVLPLHRGLGFTQFPHLGLSIRDDRVQAGMVVPNGYRRRLVIGDSFLGAMEKVCRNLESELRGADGAAPWVEIVQRRFRHRGDPAPTVHAEVRFDLRTAFPHSASSRGEVRVQREWLEAVRSAMSSKKPKLQLFVGAAFRYDRCSMTRRREILGYIAGAWLACKPLLDLVRAP